VRVLIVEDEPRLAENIARSLRESAGYAVDVATDGQEGSFLAESNTYDVVLLDLMLPQMDGMEILTRIRQAGQHTPVLVLTARDTLDLFNFAQRPASPLILKTRACPALPTKAQYLSYMPAALTQAVTYTLGLSLPQIQRLHKTMTLDQIATTRHVTPAALLADLRLTIANWVNGVQLYAYLSGSAAGAIGNDYAARIDRLLRAAPGSSLAPLLQDGRGTAILPHGTPFTTP